MTLDVEFTPLNYVKKELPAIFKELGEDTVKALGPNINSGIAIVIAVVVFVERNSRYCRRLPSTLYTKID